MSCTREEYREKRKRYTVLYWQNMYLWYADYWCVYVFVSVSVDDFYFAESPYRAYDQSADIDTGDSVVVQLYRCTQLFPVLAVSAEFSFSCCDDNDWQCTLVCVGGVFLCQTTVARQRCLVWYSNLHNDPAQCRDDDPAVYFVQEYWLDQFLSPTDSTGLYRKRIQHFPASAIFQNDSHAAVRKCANRWSL